MLSQRRLRRMMRHRTGLLLVLLSVVSALGMVTAAARLANRASKPVVTPVVALAPGSVLPAARMAPLPHRFPVLSAVHADPDRVRSVLTPLFSDGVFRRAGIAVVAEDGTTLYEHRALSPLTPASTMKLLAAASALNILGPRYRFETDLTSAHPPKNGVITGPLWLVGGGDPLLTSEDLRAGVGALARAGVRRIDGDIEVDDGAFRGPERNPKWDADDLQYDYAAGASAVSVDEGTVELDVMPSLPGNPARIQVVPANDDVRIHGEIESVLPGDGTLVHIQLEPSTKDHEKAGNVFDVDGHVAIGDAQRYRQPVHELAHYAGSMLKAMLRERGVTLAGGVRLDQAPLAAQTLWAHRSAPLEEILRDMLVTSNNHTAEQLLRVIGAQEKNVGTLQTGARAEETELARMGIPTTGLRIIDGSGLSPSDRVTALLLARLVAAELQTPAGQRFLRGLPRVGLEGTVRYHQLHDALGKARAKSGHIEGVNALAGTVQTARHGRVAFAIIVNDPGAYGGEVTTGQDRMLDALARL